MSVTKGPWRESKSQTSDYETQLLPFGHEMSFIMTYADFSQEPIVFGSKTDFQNHRIYFPISLRFRTYTPITKVVLTLRVIGMVLYRNTIP
jgi:hypothetical protein